MLIDFSCLMGESRVKLFSRIFIGLGVISIVVGVFPIVFVYPTEPWDGVLDFLTYILLDAPDRGFWQIGIVLLLVGIWLLKKQRKKGRIFY